MKEETENNVIETKCCECDKPLEVTAVKCAECNHPNLNEIVGKHIDIFCPYCRQRFENEIGINPLIKNGLTITPLPVKIEVQAKPQDEFAEAVANLKQIVEKHEDVIRVHYATSELDKKIEHVLNSYRSKAERALRGAMQFRDQVILQLRALEIVLEMTGNAQTHGEKNARLRGAIEIIDATVRKLQYEEFSIDDFGIWHGLDEGFVFRSNYPVRRLLDENRELKQKLEMLEGTENN